MAIARFFGRLLPFALRGDPWIVLIRLDVGADEEGDPPRAARTHSCEPCRHSWRNPRFLQFRHAGKTRRHEWRHGTSGDARHVRRRLRWTTGSPQHAIRGRLSRGFARYNAEYAPTPRSRGPNGHTIPFARRAARYLKAQRDLAGARSRFERTLRIFQKFLGDDHPNTQTVRRNLAGLGG